MSIYHNLAVIAGFAFVYSAVASRLERTPFSGPLVFVLFGLAVGPSALNLIDLTIEGEGLRLTAEMTLALVLFIDAANADLDVLARVKRIPSRLLLLALPLIILLGFGVASVVLTGLGVFELALIAVMLAPTDAALGKAVVSNESVPAPVRQGLNVESGLNDGICVPLLFLFLGLAVGETAHENVGAVMTHLLLEEIGIGAVVGAVLAVAGSYVLKFCASRSWTEGTWLQFPIVALAILTFMVAQVIGGSGFIACFVGGLLFGKLASQHKHSVLEAAEGTADMFALVTWLAFGAVVVGPAIAGVTWPVLIYALLSLTLVRMLPVYLCLAGLGMDSSTKLFIGWFGPRGLASIVFIVIVAGDSLPGQATMASVVVWTIILSVVLHGLTSVPLASAFGARARTTSSEK